MSLQSTLRKTTVVLAVSVPALVAVSAAAAPEVGVPGRLAQIEATLQQLADAVNPPAPPNDTTRLLFPFATNQAGLDTALVVSNTGLDSTGTVGSAGTCTFYFFGLNAPAPQTTGSVAPGQQTSELLSVFAPNFQGYVEVQCNFPLAHGFGVLSDVGFRNLAATVPALVIPSHRTTSVLESAGQ